MSMTRRIDNAAKQLEVFHTWLMSATSNHESYRKRRECSTTRHAPPLPKTQPDPPSQSRVLVMLPTLKKPLPTTQTLKTMPTDKDNAELYEKTAYNPQKTNNPNR